MQKMKHIIYNVNTVIIIWNLQYIYFYTDPEIYILNNNLVENAKLIQEINDWAVIMTSATIMRRLDSASCMEKLTGVGG